MAKRTDDETPAAATKGKSFKDAATEWAQFQCAKCGAKYANALAAAGLCEGCYGK